MEGWEVKKSKGKHMELIAVIFIAWVIISILDAKLFTGKKDFKVIEREYPDYSVMKQDNPYYKDGKQLAAFLLEKQEYLGSEKWQKKRKKVFRRDDYMCSVCGTTERLEGHHIKYSEVPNEPISHIVTLCRSCHQSQHDTYGYPSTYQEYMDWNHPI